MSAEIYRVIVIILNILSADQHAVGFDLSSVQILGGPELYQLPMRIKYSS